MHILLGFSVQTTGPGASDKVQLMLLPFALNFAIFVVEAWSYSLSSQLNYRADQGQRCHKKMLASKAK